MKAETTKRAGTTAAASLSMARISQRPATTQERQERIEAMRASIDRYCRSMCQPGGQAGSSTEAKDRAVAIFHDRLVVVEGQLGRIFESYQLE